MHLGSVRKGIVRAVQDNLKTFGLIRSRNIRIFEVGEGRFVNQDDAIEAAKDAHLSAPVDYTGKTVAMVCKAEEEPTFHDVMWSVAEVSDTEERFRVLRDDYVTTAMVQEVMEELSVLDPNWPPDRRSLIALCVRAKMLCDHQVEQSDYEYLVED